MPRRDYFVVKVCHQAEIQEFKFLTNGRFPFHSDVNSRIRRQWNISNDIPIYWEQVVFFPCASSRSKIKFKRSVCDAREYEAAQKPFHRQLKIQSAAMGFTVVLGTDTFKDAEIIKARHEGKELLKALKNLTIEYDKLKALSVKDAQYIDECQQKMKEATSTGNQDEASRWSIHLSLHQKANEANLTKLAACKSERSDISKKLEVRTFHYPTFRQFLAAEDLLDAEDSQEIRMKIDHESDYPVSGRSVSPVPDPHFPPLEDIFSGLRRAPRRPPSPIRPMILVPADEGEFWFHPEQESSVIDASLNHFESMPQDTTRGQHQYDRYGQPIFPSQANLTRSLDHINAEFPLPEGLRRPLGNLHNQLDAPYQRLMHAKDVVQNAVRDLRNYPQSQASAAELEAELEQMRQTPLFYGPSPVSFTPTWNNPHMHAPAMPESEPPIEHRRAWIPGTNIGQTSRPAPLKPRTIPWTCQYRHEHISCDGCNEGIRGMRFKCKDCADYDLCSSCLLKNQSSKVHPIEHTFNTIIHRDLERHLNKERMQEKTLPEDHPASCDLCHKRIRGIRTKCTDCPDWDCCEACLSNLGNRHPGHTLVKINLASDLVEPPFRHQKVKHTNIICDMCQGPVVGDRWKCVHPDCDDYDLCDNCHASPLNTHPREHPILKLSAPVHIDFVSRIRKETQPGSFQPGKPCDFGRREGEYATLTKQDREDLMTRWRCRDHSTFEDCERARIRCHVSKGVLQGPKPKKSSEAGSPPKRVKLNLPDVDDIKQEELPTQPESGPSNTAMEVDQPLESKPSTEIDDFAPGSHPNIIKCYIYPETLAICPAKPEEDRCITPTIDPSMDTETPTINPSIDTETPTDSPVSDIITPSNDSIFTGVKDVTIPAGCSLPVGAEFTKTWSMKHLVSGHEYKFDQLRLVHESGGLLGEACNIQLAFTQDEIKTGEKVEVSIVGLKVPDLPEQQVIEQWRFRDVDGTAYGEPLRLRFTVENPSLQNSLCNSSFIMPPPDHSAPRPTGDAQAREPSQPSTSVASTPATSQSYSSLVSLSTEPEEEFAFVNRVSSHQSIATDLTDDALASEFDFVDESEDARSQI